MERPRVAGFPLSVRYGIGPGRVGTEAFRLLRSRSQIFRGLEDAPRIALADALRFLELALRAERAVRPARNESRDEGTCRLVPTSLLSGRDADRGPFRELPTDGTGRIVVLDLATTPARSGQDAIPQGQEAHLAVVDRRIVGEACAHLSAVPTGGVADLVALHPGGVVTNNPFEDPQEVVDSAGPHQHGRVFGSAPVIDALPGIVREQVLRHVPELHLAFLLRDREAVFQRRVPLRSPRDVPRFVSRPGSPSTRPIRGSPSVSTGTRGWPPAALR